MNMSNKYYNSNRKNIYSLLLVFIIFFSWSCKEKPKEDLSVIEDKFLVRIKSSACGYYSSETKVRYSWQSNNIRQEDNALIGAERKYLGTPKSLPFKREIDYKSGKHDGWLELGSYRIDKDTIFFDDYHILVEIEGDTIMNNQDFTKVKFMRPDFYTEYAYFKL